MNYSIGDKVKFKTQHSRSEEYGPWAMGMIVDVLEQEKSYRVSIPMGFGKVQEVTIPESDIAGAADFE